jgi:hypothetical protein
MEVVQRANSASRACLFSRIKYVEDNPPKEGLPRQTHPFVLPYDGWPYTEKRG